MLQRIQSLYLFISLILLGIFILMPLFYVQSNIDTYTVYSYKIVPGQDTLNINVIPISLMAYTIGLVLLISIFLYKNRKLQKRLVQFNLVIVLIIVITIGTYLYRFSTVSSDAHIRLSLNISIPFIVSVLQYMAIRGIRKDQALIDSLNRLR
jgi:hypothetical protein